MYDAKLGNAVAFNPSFPSAARSVWQECECSNSRQQGVLIHVSILLLCFLVLPKSACASMGLEERDKVDTDAAVVQVHGCALCRSPFGKITGPVAGLVHSLIKGARVTLFHRIDVQKSLFLFHPSWPFLPTLLGTSHQP